MFKKLNLLLFIIFSLNSCGYSPIFSSDKKFDFNITSISTSGDNEINNFIKSRLNNYIKDDFQNGGYVIFIKSEYSKKTLAKDRTGKITDVKLMIKSTLEHKKNNVDNSKGQITFSESFNMKINQNNFDLRSYEQSIKKNLSQIITDKIIRHISLIE